MLKTVFSNFGGTMRKSALEGECVLMPGSEDVTVAEIEGVHEKEGVYVVREVGETIEGEYGPRRYAVTLRDATPEDRQQAFGILPDTSRIQHVGTLVSKLF